MAIKIAFINNKGGSTKTTSLVNLAGAVLNEYPGRRVLIIDGDAQGNASTSFKVNSAGRKDTIYDIFMGNVGDNGIVGHDDLDDIVVNAYHLIDIIPANTSMNFLEFDIMDRFDRMLVQNLYDWMKDFTADFMGGHKSGSNNPDISLDDFKQMIPGKLKSSSNYFNMLEDKLGVLDDIYDLILFDTPPELKAVTSSILAVCDYCVIPFEPDVYSVEGIMNILKRVGTIQKEYNPDLEVAGLLATKVRGNTRLHTDVINQVMKFCMKNNVRYFETEIPNSIRFASSTAYNGLPATIAQPGNVFAQAYYEFMEELREIGILWGE